MLGFTHTKVGLLFQAFRSMLVILCWALLAPTALAANEEKPNSPRIVTASAFAAQGTPKYSPDFEHFDYVNPQAPKGGQLKLSAIGTYDNFNRFAQRGNAAVRSAELYDTLMTPSSDEIDVYYPLIAEALEYPENHAWVIFHVDPRARDQAGQPLTAEDVAFSFNKFLEQGVPQFRAFFKNVTQAEVLDKHSVKFHFKEPSRDDILGLLSLRVFPKHFWQERDLAEPLSEPPLGTGPLTISDYKMGQQITYQRVKDYWAKDLPSRKGTLNFDSIRYDYYRDTTVALEAFKAGEYDFRQEGVAKHWAEDYDIPAVKRGDIIKEALPHSEPQPMTAMVFNTTHPLFEDRRVRQALNYALDFKWLNKNLFYEQYERTVSFFQNTEYMAEGEPSEAELAILNPLKDKLPEEVFGPVWRPNETDGSGNIRPALRKAMALLKEAGWELKERKLVNAETGQPFEFELIYYSPTTERYALPFKRNLERLGITLNLRQLDSSQFINRLRSGDFDMIDRGYSAMPYPQSVMKIVWHSDFIDSTYNTARVQDPVIDQLVNAIAANQQNPEKLLALGRAFDRVALWNFYVIPQWHSSEYRVAYWDQFDRPEQRPKYDLGLDTWWYLPEQAEQLER